MDLHVWDPLNPKITSLAVSLCMCAYACVCEYMSVISITQEHIAAESTNLVFYMCIICTHSTYKFLGRLDK